MSRAETLGRRALNRALLARQLLLARHPLAAAPALEHLLGLQAQAPLAPYVGLWTRLTEFEPETLASLLGARQAARTQAMRSTIHLLTRSDCLTLLPLMQPVRSRLFAGSAFARNLAGLDLAEIVSSGRRLLEERPLTRPELGRLLAEGWPGRDQPSLAAAVSSLLPSAQATPRGLWGQTGAAAWTTIEAWLGEPLAAPPTLEAVALRYLAAFGPACAADMRTWSGLRGLQPAFERLAPRLRRFRDEHGRELVDLDQAPRPDPDTPAPLRFLPEYDNLLFSHADRSRTNAFAYPIPLLPGNGAAQGTVLVDGFLGGVWKRVRERERVRLRVTPFRLLGSDDREALAAEGEALLAFVAADAISDGIEIETASG